MKRDRWSQIADMNENREDAACTAFEGKIVVSGGCRRLKSGFGNWRNIVLLKSVEVYDFYENKWTYLPDMIEERRNHASVSMGNKLFVIGGYGNLTCEVFDSYSRKFCCIKTLPDLANDIYKSAAICINNQVITFGELLFKHRFIQRCFKYTKIFTYNVETNKWKSVE